MKFKFATLLTAATVFYSYQMLLNVSKLGVEGTVDVLEAICRRKMKE